MSEQAHPENVQEQTTQANPSEGGDLPKDSFLKRSSKLLGGFFGGKDGKGPAGEEGAKPDGPIAEEPGPDEAAPAVAGETAAEPVAMADVLAEEPAVAEVPPDADPETVPAEPEPVVEPEVAEPIATTTVVDPINDDGETLAPEKITEDPSALPAQLTEEPIEPIVSEQVAAEADTAAEAAEEAPTLEAAVIAADQPVDGLAPEPEPAVESPSAEPEAVALGDPEPEAASSQPAAEAEALADPEAAPADAAVPDAGEEKKVTFADGAGDAAEPDAAPAAEESAAPEKKKGLGGFFSRFSKKKDQVPSADAAASGDDHSGEVAAGAVGAGVLGAAVGAGAVAAANSGDGEQPDVTAEPAVNEEAAEALGDQPAETVAQDQPDAAAGAVAEEQPADEIPIEDQPAGEQPSEGALPREGVLWKPGRIRRSSLKERTFKLSDDGHLQWTRTAWKKQKGIVLSASSAIETRDEEDSHLHPYVLEITEAGKRYTLRADSAEDRDEWAGAVKNVVDALQSVPDAQVVEESVDAPATTAPEETQAANSAEPDEVPVTDNTPADHEGEEEASESVVPNLAVYP